MGEVFVLHLPEIPEDTVSDYAFKGWKIVETGVEYGKVATITVTVDTNITIEILFEKQYTGNY